MPQPSPSHTRKKDRIVQLLVERVDIGLGGLDVHLRIDGLSGLIREMQEAAV